MEHYAEFIEITHPILEDIQKSFKSLKNEADLAYKNDLFVEWVSKQLYDHGWGALGFRYEDNDFDNEMLQQVLPIQYSFFKKYNEYIHSIAYSNFQPGTIIKPHFDRKHPHNVVRCHLGLSVPEGDCKLKVNGIEKQWKEGEYLVFDDAFVHEAWNKTNDNRIILLIDFFRDKLFA